MTNLILVHEKNHPNLIKNIINIDNWRAVGKMSGGKLYLITSDCKVFYINDCTLKKFNAQLRLGLDITKTGSFKSIALVCPKCGGRGVTDWVSDVVGVKIPSVDFEATFIRDLKSPTYRTKIFTERKSHYVYFSRAEVPEAHKLCTKCRGTGLFMMTGICDSDIREYNFK